MESQPRPADVPVPKLGKIEITTRCPSDCEFCYNVVKCTTDTEERCAPETLVAIVDELHRGNVHSLNFTGGEPMTTKDLLFAGLKRAAEHKQHTSVTTNLTLATKDDICRLKEYDVGSVLGSFPSVDPVIYELMTKNKLLGNALARLDDLRRYDINTAVSMVVTPTNKHLVRSTGKFMHENYGVMNFTATPIFPTVKQHIPLMLSRDDILGVFDTLLELKGQYGIYVSTLRPMPYCFYPDHVKYSDFIKSCGAAESEIYLDNKGNLSPCGSLQDIVGNILKEGIANCLPRLAKYYDRKRSIVVPKECDGCVEVDRCRGGCRAEAECVNKSVCAVSPYIVGPLKERIYPAYAQPVNFYRHSIVFDPETTITGNGDNFTIAANGAQVPLNPHEKNMVALLYANHVKLGKPLQQITDENQLNAYTVNAFLNALLEKGIVRYKAQSAA